MTIRITTGVDAIEIDRIAAAVDRWNGRFLNRVYTDDEITYCGAKAERLAGRFAAKEATSKALGVGIRTLRWRDIEVVRGARGKPHLLLHGRAAEIAAAQQLTHFDLSITHSRSDAIAVVVAWGPVE